jgi:hypothetical protein
MQIGVLPSTSILNKLINRFRPLGTYMPETTIQLFERKVGCKSPVDLMMRAVLILLGYQASDMLGPPAMAVTDDAQSDVPLELDIGT